MEYDYIIIGAGAAGCVLAYRLTENPSTRVLLIEYGGSDANPLHYIPKGIRFLPDAQATKLVENVTEVRKMLFGLIKYLEARNRD